MPSQNKPLRRLRFIQSAGVDPYRNLALEEWLLTHCGAEECILYLWQNQKTVVLGRNQNAWKECRVERLEADGGHLVRRLSGGGAVYHDLGNLNFTFLVQKPHYSVERQLSVILQAVQSLGIRAEKSGRNDLHIEGRKFSGNAFYRQGQRCYHHGTLMVDVNEGALAAYLSVDPEKLQARGVDSVRSRVTNLRTHCPMLTISALKQALVQSFSEVYQMPIEPIPSEEVDEVELTTIESRLRSEDWCYGKSLPFDYALRHRFPWGDMQLQLAIAGGSIQEAAAYSDALATDPVAEIPQRLRGIPFRTGAMAAALRQDTAEELLLDLAQWVEEVDLT